MNFSQRLNAVFKVLGVPGSEMSRKTGLDASLISRLRTGVRVPKSKSRQTAQLAEGVCFIALDRNVTDKLEELCGVRVTGEEEKHGFTCRQLIRWLYEDNQAQYTPCDEDDDITNASHTSVRSFGRKLDTVMKLLNITNIRLAKALNVDPSLISRYRAGERMPVTGNETVYELSEYLCDRALRQNQLEELMGIIRLVGGGRDIDEIISCFSSWLLGRNVNVEQHAVNVILKKFDSGIQPVAGPSQQRIKELTGEVKDTGNNVTYYGEAGIRSAMLRMFVEALNMPEEQCIYFYADRNMAWLVEDYDYRLQWIEMVEMNLRKGNRIVILHSIYRSEEEIFSALETMLPLYIMGKIEPYYYKSPAIGAFSHTLLVHENVSVISGFTVNDCEDIAEYRYTRDKQELALWTKSFCSLLENSMPLLQVYNDEDYSKLSLVSVGDALCGNDRFSLVRSMPLSSMPEDLLESIMTRAGFTTDEKRKARAYRVLRRENLLRMLEKGTLTSYCVMPQAVEQIPNTEVNFGSLFSGKRVTYTVAEFRRHMKYVAEVMYKYNSFCPVPIKTTPLAKTQLMVCRGEYAIVSKADANSVAMRFTNPMITQALEKFICSFSDTALANAEENLRENAFEYIRSFYKGQSE